jgi:hypothetical protein
MDPLKLPFVDGGGKQNEKGEEREERGVRKTRTLTGAHGPWTWCAATCHFNSLGNGGRAPGLWSFEQVSEQ